MKYYEKTITKELIHKGGIINLEKLVVELPNNNQVNRDIVRHPGASAVVAINDKNEVYVVRQFRKPIDKELIEIPAGKLDKDENPLECAKRELKEETGLISKSIELLTSIHTSPGFADEVLHIYLALDLEEGDSNPDENEFLSCEKIHIDKLLKMIEDKEITDAKTIVGLLYAKYLNLNK